MANKPLIIDVQQKSIPNGVLNQWDMLTNTNVFINDIQTPKLSKNTNVGQLVSGIPTAFARVDLFKKALDFVASNPTSSSTDGNIISYYYQLNEEWRGLIACLALDYAHIKVRRVNLTYSDNKPIEQTNNIYEPKGAFGNMLLERAGLWCDQNLPSNQTAVPYINIIKYNEQVVGATSPETLLFTSTGYKCKYEKSTPWIDVNTGKFIDPLRSVITPEQVSVLYAYICHLITALDAFQASYTSYSELVSYTSIGICLQNWKTEIVNYAESNSFDLSIASIPPVSAEFSGPFKELFCHKDILFGLEGIIVDAGSNTQSGSIEFDPKDLLLDESAQIAPMNIRIKPEDIHNLPILVMTADRKGEDSQKDYFALPLSAQGLNVFGKNTGALVGMLGSSSAITSTLKATYDPTLKNNNLEVVLTLVTASGNHRTFKKVYTAGTEVRNKDILIWPNFISPQWDSYYMYNELPHNGITKDYRAFPFVGEMQNNYFRILLDDNKLPILLSSDGKITAPNNKVNAELLVQSDDAVADNPYKYEIYRSDKPFKGVRLLSPTGNEGGFILINYSSAQGTLLPQDMMRPGATPSLSNVNIGIDFGSTNTSIAYSSDNTGEKGFVFKNHRVSLMGNELPGSKYIPKENQIFFFQGFGPEVKSNSIKSVLTLHDSRRLPSLQQGQSRKMRDEREVIGGFPCFGENLPFSDSKDKEIILNFPNVGQVKQIHNMKWEDNDEDKAHKSAFLRTLMLHVYATLFVDGFVPKKLKWSFPSAMGGQLLFSYQNIWNTLSGLSPVLDADGKKYPLDVSRCQSSFGNFGGSSGGFGGSSGGFGSSSGGFGSSDGGFSGSSGGFGGSSGGFGSSDGGFGSSDGGFGSSSSGFGSSYGGFGGSDAGFGNSNNSFGGSNGTVSNTNSQVQTDFMPDDPDKKVSYEPTPIYQNSTTINHSLSEAEAVANYISTRYAKEANVLNICFDVGGSTTDISALFLLGNNLTMIKQNSIRFAAQRVSKSVGRMPEFKRVLDEISDQFKIKMVGLNMGENSYNANTASYFFDQIVNRLDDSQLESLYQSIAANCPKLMCVNLYVTGLLMFYAGQLAHKLVDDLNKAEEWMPKTKPNVRVTFAGKGARLFQWLPVIDNGAATHYYNTMFIKGYGETHLKSTLAGWQQIVLPKLGDPDIKYEVSKGLAKGDTNLYHPTTEQPSEIIGESNFALIGNDQNTRIVDFTNSITPEMMQQIGIRFVADGSQTYPQFTEFCGFFYKAANSLFGWNANPNELVGACRNMNITAFVQNMPEYRNALRNSQQKNEPFSFVAPIIILEGMKFYDETLLNLL